MKTTKEFDPWNKKKGRGFYICPECINMGNKVVDKDKLKQQIEKQIISLLQLGWRSRQIKIGYDDVLFALKKGQKGFLILAEDISKRTQRNILFKYTGDYYKLFTKDKLGRAIGKNEVGIIFIPQNKYGQKLKQLIEKYEQIR